MEPQRCKGTHDLLPEDMARFRYVEQIFMSCCKGWGYKEIKTPTLEHLHMFTSTGTLTPSMLNRVYSFLDWDGWSGERVVLRPEATIPVTRLYIDNVQELSHPAKLFYIENIFSFEETGKESRERWQYGAEFIGCDKPSADVELILLAVDILGKLGVKGVELHLSHAGLLRALLQRLELSTGEQSKIFDKILDGDIEILKEIIGDTPHVGNSLKLLFELKGKSSGFLKNLKASLIEVLPELELSIENFINVADFLSTMECEYQINMASGKGFEYYTGLVFQLYFEGQKIGGGGRYNDLIPLLGGGDVPSSGFALYIDKIIDLLPFRDYDELNRVVSIRNNVDLSDDWRLSFETADRLRKEGYLVVLDHGDDKINDCSWMLEIQSKGKSPFLLLNRVKGNSIGLSTITEVLSILREARANENSST